MVNGLQEKEEMTAETAEEQLVENAAEMTPSPETETAEAAPVEDKAAALEAELKEKSDRILRLQADFEIFAAAQRKKRRNSRPSSHRISSAICCRFSTILSERWQWSRRMGRRSKRAWR